MGFPTVLFLVFLVLKLTDNIDWSWWWVTAPLWIEVLALFVFIAFTVAVTPSRAKKAKNLHDLAWRRRR